MFGAVEAEAAAGGVEETVELFGEDALAAHAFAPVVGVEFAAVERAQAIDDTGFFRGRMIVEPFQENVFDGEREADRDVTGAAGAGFGGGGEDGGHFVVGETGNDGRDHDASGNAGGGKFANGAQASSGARGARFEFSGEIGVEGRDGDVDEDAVETGEFGKDVEVAGDERVFRDDEDWVAELGADFEAGAGETKVAFGGLVAVGGTAHGDGLRLPFFRGEFATEEFGRAEFDEDLGFEIEAAAPAEVFVIGAGEAVGAAVLYVFGHCSLRPVSDGPHESCVTASGFSVHEHFGRCGTCGLEQVCHICFERTSYRDRFVVEDVTFPIFNST